MTLSKQDIRLHETAFRGNFNILFERTSDHSYDNIIVKGIYIFQEYLEQSPEMRKMSLDMQGNFYTDRDIKQRFAKDFPEYILANTIENINSTKVQLIFSKKDMR